MGKRTASYGPPTNCAECGTRFHNPQVISRTSKVNRVKTCPPCTKRLKAEKQRKKQENNPT